MHNLKELKIWQKAIDIAVGLQSNCQVIRPMKDLA
jgi:hypothetical protein